LHTSHTTHTKCTRTRTSGNQHQRENPSRWEQANLLKKNPARRGPSLVIVKTSNEKGGKKKKGGGWIMGTTECEKRPERGARKKIVIGVWRLGH